MLSMQSYILAKREHETFVVVVVVVVLLFFNTVTHTLPRCRTVKDKYVQKPSTKRKLEIVYHKRPPSREEEKKERKKDLSNTKNKSKRLTKSLILYQNNQFCLRQTMKSNNFGNVLISSIFFDKPLVVVTVNFTETDAVLMRYLKTQACFGFYMVHVLQ